MNLGADLVNVIVGLANLGGVLVGIVLLKYFGRKTIMLWGNASMTVCLFGLAFALKHDIKIATIIFVFAYVAFFEFSVGPVFWLYAAEIL